MSKKKTTEQAPKPESAVVKLRLGACLSATTRRMREDLYTVAQRLNIARNAMVRAWERWLEDHPEHKPEPLVSRKTGQPVVLRGTPVVRNEPLPPQVYVPQVKGVRSANMLLYYVGTEAVPEVDTGLVGVCAADVLSRLKANVPHNHTGRAHYRWQAVRDHEMARDCHRGLHIPVLNNFSTLCYEGECSRELSPGVMARVRRAGMSSCVLRFPLFSRQSGREVRDVIVRLEVRQLPAGFRELLRRVVRGVWKFQDSELVEKNGDWFLHLTYQQPARNLGLDASRVAVLAPLPGDGSHPMGISCGDSHWSLGWVSTLLRERQRLEDRRQVLRHRYRVKEVGPRGHGKRRFYARLRPVTDQHEGLMRRFLEGMVAEAMKFCVRRNCGTVLYREPSMNLRRDLSWFSRHDIPFDWTRFASSLRYQCYLHGIQLTEQRIGCAEFRGDQAPRVEKVVLVGSEAGA